MADDFDVLAGKERSRRRRVVPHDAHPTHVGAHIKRVLPTATAAGIIMAVTYLACDLQKKNQDVTITLNGKEYHAQPKDSLLRDLSGKTYYLDSENATDTAHLSQEAFGQLSGSQILNIIRPGNLISDYLDPDGQASLRRMVGRKAAFRKGEKGPSAQTIRFLEDLADDYRPHKRMDLDGFKSLLDERIVVIDRRFDKEDYLKDRHAQKQDYFRALTSLIDKDMVLATITTETFPKVNPLFTYRVLEEMLTTKGLSYLAAIPAQNDTLLSYGIGQPTPDILQGLAEMNGYLPRSLRVPESMEDLTKADDQVDAKILTMYQNAMLTANVLFNDTLLSKTNTLLQDMTEEERKDFANRMYAALHHRPTEAVKGLERAVRRSETGTQLAARLSFGNGVDEYVKKQAANYQGAQLYEDQKEGFFGRVLERLF